MLGWLVLLSVATAGGLLGAHLYTKWFLGDLIERVEEEIREMVDEAARK